MIWLIYCTGLRIFRVVAEPRNSGKSANSYKIHKNLQNTTKFGENLIKYMSVQHIWNLFQLLVLFTCCKRANLSWNFVTETCKQRLKLSGVDYVAKTWALAMMLKALPLVHFLSVLLLKEQMITSVKKNAKLAVFYRLLFGKVCPEIFREIPAKSADFSANLPLKIPRNLTFFSATYQKP